MGRAQGDDVLLNRADVAKLGGYIASLKNWITSAKVCLQ